METEKLIAHAKALRERIQTYAAGDQSGNQSFAARAQVCEFLRIYAGPKSAFFKQAELIGMGGSYLINSLTALLNSYVEYLQSGLASAVPPERQAQLDVVSDILGQAQQMLEENPYHPAAPAVLIGAALEEFLRNWVEAEGLSIANAKPGLDAYCKALRAAELLSKQDVKDVTAWAGIRNHAAHGEWEEVGDRARVRLMLEGVNLFLRQKMSTGQ